MRSASAPLFLLRLLFLATVAACGQDTGRAGTITVHLVGDGSFDPVRVTRLELRVDGDGAAPLTLAVASTVGLGNSSGVEQTYTPTTSGPLVLVFGGSGFDSGGGKIAAGLASPISITAGDTADVYVFLSTAGYSGDGGTPDLVLPTPPDFAQPSDGGVPQPDLAAPPLDGATSLDQALPLGDLAVPTGDLSGPCGTLSCVLGCNVPLNRCNRPLPTNLGTTPKDSQFTSDVVIKQYIWLDVAPPGRAYDDNGQQHNLGFQYADIPQQNGQPRIAVFFATSLTIADSIQLRLFDSSQSSTSLGRSALFVTSGDMTIDGSIVASAFGDNSWEPGAGRLAGPGGYYGSRSDGAGGGPMSCGGGSGRSALNGDDGGGGGAASAAVGGSGSRGPAATAGAGGTAVFASPSPLVGGCGGGSGSNSVSPFNGRGEGGGGGGALQLSAGGTIKLGVNCVLAVAGNGGNGGADVGAAGGGGGGGMLLLEAANLTVDPFAILSANGGGGGGGGNGNGNGSGGDGECGPPAILPALGGMSMSGGGGGGWISGLPGASAPAAGSINGGGGGGAVGNLFTITGTSNVPSGTISAKLTKQVVTKTY